MEAPELVVRYLGEKSYADVTAHFVSANISAVRSTDVSICWTSASVTAGATAGVTATGASIVLEVAL